MNPMDSLGNELKAARAKKSVSLETIAEAIKINPRYLRSLEESRFEDLPGGMYNRAFLRAYCEYLDLDPKEMLRRYEAETAPVGDKAPKSKTKAFRPASSPSPHPLFIWSAVLLATVFGLYLSREWITSVFSPYFTRPAQQVSPQAIVTPSQPQRSSEPTKEPAPPSGTQVNPAETANPASSVPSEALQAASKEKTEASKSEPESALPRPPATAPEVGAAEPSAQPQQKALRVAFHGMQECWISVTGDGKRLYQSIIRPGEDRSFDADERFLIILGNAGGVSLRINGKQARALGKPGEVLKFEVTPSNLSEWLEKTTG